MTTTRRRRRRGGGLLAATVAALAVVTAPMTAVEAVGDDTGQRLELPHSWIRNDEPVQVVLVGHGQARGARGVSGAHDVPLRRFRYR